MPAAAGALLLLLLLLLALRWRRRKQQPPMFNGSRASAGTVAPAGYGDASSGCVQNPLYSVVAESEELGEYAQPSLGNTTPNTQRVSASPAVYAVVGGEPDDNEVGRPRRDTLERSATSPSSSMPVYSMPMKKGGKTIPSAYEAPHAAAAAAAKSTSGPIDFPIAPANASDAPSVYSLLEHSGRRTTSASSIPLAYKAPDSVQAQTSTLPIGFNALEHSGNIVYTTRRSTVVSTGVPSVYAKLQTARPSTKSTPGQVTLFDYKGQGDAQHNIYEQCDDSKQEQKRGDSGVPPPLPPKEDKANSNDSDSDDDDIRMGTMRSNYELSSSIPGSVAVHMNDSSTNDNDDNDDDDGDEHTGTSHNQYEMCSTMKNEQNSAANNKQVYFDMPNFLPPSLSAAIVRGVDGADTIAGSSNL